MTSDRIDYFTVRQLVEQVEQVAYQAGRRQENSDEAYDRNQREIEQAVDKVMEYLHDRERPALTVRNRIGLLAWRLESWCPCSWRHPALGLPLSGALHAAMRWHPSASRE